MYKTIKSYFKNHVFYNSAVHITLGVGIGILLTYPFIGSHPLRWGIGLLIIGLLGHFYPLVIKKG